MATPFASSLESVEPTLSTDERTTALLSSSAYRKSNKPLALTFSFPDLLSTWSDADYSDSGEPFFDAYRGLGAAERANAVGIFAEWAKVANIALTQVPDTSRVVGDIRVAYTDVNASPGDDGSTLAYAYLPGESPFASDIWMGFDSFDPDEDLAPGTLSGHTLLHEIGHTLGLKHPFDVETLDDDSVFNDVTLPTAEDTLFYTVMSYDALPGFAFSEASFYPTTPMPYDILAIQHLYGANTRTGKGNTTYAFRDDTEYFQTIWDAGGKDTISYAGATQGGQINLEPGNQSLMGAPITFTDGDGAVIDSGRSNFFTGTVFIAFGCIIENAIGGNGNDGILGNVAANRLSGGGGDDLILGGAGADTLTGGSGADRFVVDAIQNLSASAKRSDVFTDFKPGEDLIDLSGIGFNIGQDRLLRGQIDQAEADRLSASFLRFSGSAPVAGQDATGEVWFSKGVLYISTDADIAAEGAITLAGVRALSADDLVLARA